MNAPVNHDRIRWYHRRYESKWHSMDSAPDQDTYMLIAPLRRSNVKVIRDGQVLVDGEVRPGMLRLTTPGERVQVSTGSAVEHIILLIPGPDMRRILNDQDTSARGGKRCIDPLMRPDRLVAQAAAASLRADSFDAENRQLYIDGLAYMMLARLLMAHPQPSNNARRVDDKMLSNQEFEKCCQYADSMMEKKLSLGPWAAMFDMTSTEFTKSFRQRTQESPYAWYLNRRIDRAKRLLRSPTASLAEIAFSVGFCSQSHFTEAFRRRVGCSPARWRASTRAGF